MKSFKKVMFLIGMVSILSAAATADRAPDPSGSTAADIVALDAMKVFGALERPPVYFPHDRHTQALNKTGQDCLTCHPTRDDRLITKFQRLTDTDRTETMDVYHDRCLACHEQNAATGQTTGPVTCGECHRREPGVLPKKSRPVFDRSLHHRHLEATEKKCENCHHEYDEALKKLVYRQGQEIPCRNCHPSETPDNTMSYRQAAHQACIGCHRQAQAENRLDSQRVVWNSTCAGCHAEERIQLIGKLDVVPRLERGQPDMAFVKSFADMSKLVMDGVLFNHRLHEEKMNNCGTCHHKTMEACDSCHTLSGSDAGKGISLTAAMHEVNSQRSCTGCHAEAQRQRACIGCHPTRLQPSAASIDGSCTTCHTVPMADLRKAGEAGRPIRAQDFPKRSQLAPIDPESVPEEVLIDGLAKSYPTVRFLHRDHLDSLLKEISGNALATAFHQGEGLVCRSCHHHAPGVTDPPPACLSCHDKAVEAVNELKPAAQAAYHQQCFGCHVAMEVWEKQAATECTECHEE